MAVITLWLSHQWNQWEGSWNFSGFDLLLLCGNGGILRRVNELLGVFLLAWTTWWLIGGANSALFTLLLPQTRTCCLRQSAGRSDEQNRASVSIDS